MLPLTFSNPSDYDKIEPSDRVSLLGLAQLTPGKVQYVPEIEILKLIMMMIITCTCTQYSSVLSRIHNTCTCTETLACRCVNPPFQFSRLGGLFYY